MIHYLSNPGLFERLNGVVKGATPSRPSLGIKPSCKLVVPKIQDGGQLQAWAISKGLPPAPAGMSTDAYYKLLVNHAKRLNASCEQQVKVI